MVGKYKGIHMGKIKSSEMKDDVKKIHWFSHSKNMANNISSSINLLLVKSDIALYIRIPKFWLFLFIIWKDFFSLFKVQFFDTKKVIF